jgi:anthranilate phosphoribosyltransferase
MGVYAPHLVPLAAEAMVLLNTRHAFVVHGEINGDHAGGTSDHAGGPSGDASGPNGIDEFSISGPTHVAEVHNGIVTLSTIAPEELGLTRAPIETLQGGDARTNAQILTAIFAGERSPRRDIVLLNAAAVLVTADLAPDLPTGIALAAQAIDTGVVTALVRNLSNPKP